MNSNVIIQAPSVFNRILVIEGVNNDKYICYFVTVPKRNLKRKQRIIYFKERKKMYTEQNLVRIAKRENNQKRNYLVVNRLQGKHIPVKPHEAFAMFQALAAQVRGQYNGEKLLVIGFAETATAIGAAVAMALNADYIQTTRELVPNVAYLYFSEEHSHATEQKLVKEDIDSAVKTIDRILFVEDEVTTGKTILNIIEVLRGQYSKKIKFSVASVLNGMDCNALDIYGKYGINLFWLVKTNHTAYTEIVKSFKGDGTYISCKQINEIRMPTITYIKIDERMDTRRVVHCTQYYQFCKSLYQNIVSQTDLGDAHKILVLGTEEYMYPALYTASQLEAQGKEVRFHATTRSPITVSTEQEYPLHVRYELMSLYDSARTTYVYELQKYDMVIIITDASDGMKEGVFSLVNALKLCGNEHILVVS